MRAVSELYGRHAGQDIYVLGTGASVRVFPLEFLRDKVTIGLNLAWKIAPVTYGLTTRPELNIPEFLPGEAPRPEITWITKYEKLVGEAQRAHGRARFYFFDSQGKPSSPPPGEPNESGRMLEWVRRPTGDKLYLWTSVSQTAANLAANLGAKNVILVGCDNCALLGNHHAHSQHTFWKGEDPDVRYRQYYDGLCEVREALRERQVELLSLTPFVSLDRPGDDFVRLCAALGKDVFIDNPDISAAQGDVKVRRARERVLAYARGGLTRLRGLLGRPRR